MLTTPSKRPGCPDSSSTASQERGDGFDGLYRFVQNCFNQIPVTYKLDKEYEEKNI